ncbi:amino acid adenylation domain-containing protein [Corallococcus sp. CA053C]|uniref:non-ribosomal peptide synthetase n=1 Tax=Corallococcus sp. CA053C TaxID=2316732 RepID=UPI000EA22749|nr:non-ribosomal peptide synthetase [Corallococcus sp. CA053C]RKH09839.1 amino acid adenylation domain-containing protein [Corallococcus sp. CA053C]
MRISTSLIGSLESHAGARPSQLAYRYLTTGDVDGPVETLTWAELDRRVRAVAAALQQAGLGGERVLLLYPPGLDFIIAFLGCLSAGVIAAPAYPPDPSRLERTLGRLRSIAQDCGARAVLTTEVIAGMAEALLPMAPELGALRWIASDAVPDSAADSWRHPARPSSDVAFLQYTSGSTGTPKGVVITHDNLLHNERMLQQGFRHTPQGSGLGWLPLYHDMGLIGNVLQPLHVGMPCTMMSPLAFLQRPARWLQAISTFRAASSGGPNFAYDLCVRKVTEAERAGLDLSSWEVAFNGAEPVRGATLERFAETFAAHGFRRSAFYPCYGLAEATLFVTGPDTVAAPVPVSLDASALEQGRVVLTEAHGARSLVGCGQVWLDQQVAIVDPTSRRRVGPDGVGEIWVSGPSVARGYWNRPEESAATFGARIEDTGEGPFLRTGDLGFLHEGSLFVTGRLKDVVIVRGRNLYPQDVELTAEQAHPAVRLGCAAAFGIEVEGEEQLVVVAEFDERSGAAPADVATAVREAVAAEHGVIVHAVALLQSRTLPKTTSGKVQRHACRNAFLDGTLALASDVAFAAPRVKSPRPEGAKAEGLEGWLIERIATLSGTPGEDVDPEQPFARYGLDSTDLVGLSGELESRLNRSVSPALLYEQPSITALVRHLEGKADQGPSAAIPRSAAPETEPGPVSPGGARLLVLDRLSPGSPLYNVHAGLRMKGALDTAALKQALEALTTRHPMLRATFPELEGRPVLVVQPVRPTELSTVDLRGLAPERREAERERLSTEHATTPFDMVRGPLLRTTLVTLGDEEHVLLLTQHHIITDAWSLGVVARELAELYEGFRGGSPRTLPELPVRYSDHVRWQEARLQGEDARRSRTWWREHLAGLPRLDLPTSRTPLRGTTHAGDACTFVLSEQLTAGLRELARRESCTLYVTLLAAWATLLHRYCGGQTDFGIGTVTAGRDRRELRDVVGFFVNTLVLRCDLSGDPEVGVLMRRLRGAVEGALRHQEVPFDQVVSAVGAPRGQDLNPLFRAGFMLENAPFPTLSLPGLAWTPVQGRPDGGVPGTAKFELGLSMVETDGKLSAAIEYATDLFDAATLERMASHFQRLVEGFVAEPGRRVSELGLLTEGERHRVLVEWNTTRRPYEAAGLAALLEAQAARTPDAVALVCGEERLTYLALHRRANALALRLRALGVGPEVVVGLCARRSVELVVGMLGILKAGGAYLPLDPHHPAERLAYMREDSGVRLLLTQAALAGTPVAESVRTVLLDAPETRGEASEHGPRDGAGPEHLAYVLYTSGSTGRPKGVQVSQRNVANFFAGMDERVPVGPRSVWLAVTSVSFDISVLELLWTLARGFQVVVQGDEVGAGAVLAQVREHAVTHLQGTPSLAGALLLEPGAEDVLGTLRCLLVGGEALPPALASSLANRLPRRLLNMYGPTETTVWSSTHTVEAAESPVPIGRPIANTELYVLDARLGPVPDGVAGELYIGGEGVVRGYRGRPALTAERFVPDPFSGRPGARLYRTGDLARWKADGTLEFLGRVDFQVKLRGFRIELGEIETVLTRHPSVRAAVAVVREDVPGDKRLVAYVASPSGSGGPTLDTAALRAHLRDSLPEYMVPAAIVVLETLPLTPNGKVDRKALPTPQGLVSEARYVAPRTPTEARVAVLFAELLRVERISAEDSFFELGGHSLLAMQLVSRLRAAFGREVPLRRLFDSPTVVGVAALLGDEAPANLTPLHRVARDGALPLSFAQQRMWFLHQLEPGSAFYNVPGAVRMDGALDAEALRLGLEDVVRRHESLRTTFHDEHGQPVQIIHPAGAFHLSTVDLTEAPDAKVQREANEEAARPFDLSRGPLFRAKLLVLGPRSHVLLVTMHHIVSDGWSLGVLVRELAALYEGRVSNKAVTLAELPVQYADFADWQKRWLAGGVLEQQVAYWKTQLADVPAVLELPTDFARPAVQTHRGATVPVKLGTELSRALDSLAKHEGVTPFMLLLAAWQVLLARYASQRDFAVGSPIAGRTRAETEGLIGFFANTLVLRAKLGGNPSFRTLLARVKETTLGAYAHQDVPFEKLVEELQPRRSLSHTPLFQVMFALQQDVLPHLRLPGVELKPYATEASTAKFDLTLSLTETERGLEGTLEYSTDLFAPKTVQGMARHLEVLLEGIAARPEARLSELPLLTAAERDEVLVGVSGSDLSGPVVGSVHGLVEAQVDRTPDATALVFDGKALTYAELDARANQLAHHLRSLGVGPETLVGVSMSRSAEIVVAVLAVLKAGGAYVPMDPAYPRDRLGWMLEDARAPVLLTEARLRGSLGAHGAHEVCLDSDGPRIRQWPTTRVENRSSVGNLAYVLYTSGSTGRPKGVAIEHRSAVAFLHWAVREFSPRQLAGVMAGTSLNFDISVFEMFAPLSSGGTVIVAENALALPTLRDKARVTLLNTVPSAMAELVRSGGVPPTVRTVNLAGESLSNRLVQAVYAAYPEVECVSNLFGPTEDTTYSTIAWVPKGATTEPTVGRPVTGTRGYVLDAWLCPVPRGIPGELYLGGAGLSRGYLGKPGLTAERYVPDPFSAEPDARMYRTGDRVRWLPNGELEALGRIDFQVKLRGFRIELGEVESALRAHPSVGEVVALVREDVPGDKRLVAYVVAGEGGSSEVLRAHVRGSLPEYMVPSAIVVLEALPLNPNGKVDRKALPKPELPTAQGEYVAPRTLTEAKVAELFTQLLRVERAGAEDSFFELGGHSLLAMQLVSRLRATFQVEARLRDVFEAPTVAGVAVAVEAARSQGGAAGAPPITRRSRETPPPLSYAQQRLWFLDRLEPDSPLYNMPAAVRLTGPLSVSALQQALQELVRRHEALRTTFPTVDGQAHQAIASDLPLSLSVIDLRDSTEAEMHRLAMEEARTPFHLAHGPLLRAKLLRRSDQEHVLLLTMHHIVSDGWSQGVLVRELGALYEAFTAGRPSPLPELPIQYADYAVWQRQWLAGDVLASELSWWKQQLHAAPPALELPTDRPRPAVRTYRGSVVPVALSRELSDALAALSRREGGTLFMTLLAAFQVLLHRHSGQDDIVVGSPIAGRTRAETEGLIGFFVNTLALRTKLDGDPSFRELLARVREVTLGAYAHQDVPFEKLVEELAPVRDLRRPPLFQVMFVLQNTPMPALALGEATLEPLPFAQTVAKFELTLSLEETAEGLRGSLEYNTDLFDAATVERMAGHYRTLLEGLVAEPGQTLSRLPLLTEGERHQLVVAWNQTRTALPREHGIAALFEAQVARTPDAVAVVFGDQRLTYRELDRRANQLGHHLKSRGVGPEVLVGLCVERSVELVVGLLGILKAGGAYLPLDPGYPQERLAFLLEDTGTPLVLAQRHLVEKLPAKRPPVLALDAEWDAIATARTDAPVSGAGPESLAYVIYTSGSTGRPKGVCVLHRGVVRLVKETGYARFSAEEVFLQVAPLSFDASTFEIWGALLNGGRLVVFPPERPTLTALGETVKREGVTTLWLTASLFNTMVDEQPEALRPLRQLLAGGEALSVPHVKRALTALPGVRLINGYGPTESTTFACCHTLTEADLVGSIPIGRPIANTVAYVLDRHGSPVPIGVAGELHLGGDGVARGYLNRPELTAERFVPDPFSSDAQATLYKTGDVVRYRADGVLEFLGRADHQVKLRGFRIELGEIESVLAKHPQVREAAVVVREDVPGDKRLVAYVVASTAAGRSASEVLRAHLRDTLPEHMVPTAFVELPALPLTANGKLDRKALPPPDMTQADAHRTYVAPRTPVEETLATLWAEVLRVPRVGSTDSFFELGGHSLLAMQVLSRMRAAFGVDIPLRALFEAPTVAALGERVETALRSGTSPEAPGFSGVEASTALVPIAPRASYPLSPPQRRYWRDYVREPQRTWSNIFTVVPLGGGTPGAEPIERALNELLARHESLRTAFPREDGERVQVVAPEARCALKVTDLTHLAPELRAKAIADLRRQESTGLFDLEKAPLLRAHLVHAGEGRSLLLMTVHHLVADGWSLFVMRQEFGAIYADCVAGRPVTLPPPALQYKDYAEWHNRLLDEGAFEADRRYWLNHLARPLPPPPFADFASSDDSGDRGGAAYRVLLPDALWAQVKQVAGELGVSPFVVLLTGFYVLIHDLEGSRDIIVGTPLNGRDMRQFPSLVGIAINLVMMRVRFDGGDTFASCAAQVQNALLSAMQHQSYQNDRILADLGFPSGADSFALTTSFFSALTLDEPVSPELRAAAAVHEVSATDVRFDAMWYAMEHSDGMVIDCRYCRRLFPREVVEQQAQRYLSLLAQHLPAPRAQLSSSHQSAA